MLQMTLLHSRWMLNPLTQKVIWTVSTWRSIYFFLLISIVHLCIGKASPSHLKPELVVYKKIWLQNKTLIFKKTLFKGFQVLHIHVRKTAFMCGFINVLSVADNMHLNILDNNLKTIWIAIAKKKKKTWSSVYQNPWPWLCLTWFKVSTQTKYCL